MIARFRVVLLSVLSVLAAAVLTLRAPALAQVEDTDDSDGRILRTEFQDWTGDFDGMMERCFIRIAVPYGRTLFFHDLGRERGLTAELARKFEAEEGYDPNKWFNNVERIVARKVGQEPVTYVRNIYKYYVSYKLALEAAERQRAAGEQLPDASPDSE
jgi:membrane-bound lytic murein transglycosylase MltF